LLIPAIFVRSHTHGFFLVTTNFYLLVIRTQSNGRASVALIREQVPEAISSDRYLWKSLSRQAIFSSVA